MRLVVVYMGESELFGGVRFDIMDENLRCLGCMILYEKEMEMMFSKVLDIWLKMFIKEESWKLWT